MQSSSAKKRSVEELQRDSSGVVYSDERILLHLQQVNDLALELLSDVFNFRLVDQSNGLNEESVNECALTLREFMEHEVKIRSTVIRSKKIYAEVKSLYMSMQDVKTYLGQAMRLPATTSKDIFISPFKTISAKMKATFKALLGAVLAEINSMRAPNSSICAAQYQLGVTHMYGLDGKSQNYILAVDNFQEAADQGNTDAMVILARCHLHGHGVDRNEIMGFDWLAKAANSRMCPHAKDELAMLIIRNLREVTPSCIKDYCATLLGEDASTVRSQTRHSSSRSVSFKDTEEDEEDATTYGVEDAIKLLLSAAADGCVEAKSNLGSIYEEAGDLEQAASWYTQASEEGCVKGTYLLGHLYLKGKLNASKTKTFNLLKQAARGGQTDAFYALGTCYETGIGVEINLDSALQHYRISANGKSKIGMYSLGYLLVQNAIEMRKRIKHMRPYAATAHAKVHTGSAVVMENNPDDERLAELREEAEATLQEGIHWLRAASENHIKDAAFQLGRLYEQAIGVPDDSFAALSNYKWAAHLGHTRAAFYAGNLLYAHANSRNIHSVSEAAMFYHQAALGGIVEAMNSYAILLEDGRASEMGLKDLHLAAAWFYQACIETERLEKSYINLAMLLISTPLSSFRTIPGDIVTLPDAKDFLLDFFESDGFTDNDRRGVILQMIDEIDENSKTALPLVEEVSLSLVPPRRSNRAASRYDQHNRERSNSGAAGSKASGQLKRGTRENKVEVDVDEHEEVEVSRIPTSTSLSSRNSGHSTYRTNRVVHEEVHKLNRGPIQNVGISYNHAYSEEKLSPPRGMSPPAHVQSHRAGELYNTDGPVIPPSFVPRATQYAAPGKSDKPAPRTKTTPGFTAAYDGLELQHPDSLIDPHNPTAAPSVPVLSSPTRKQNVPPKPPRSRETSGTLAAPAQSQSNPPPPQPVQPRVQSVTERVAVASTTPQPRINNDLPGAQSPAAEVHAKHATRRLSFISGLVTMMGKDKKDKDGSVRDSSASPARARITNTAPVTTTVPFQTAPVPTRDDSARRSMDSLDPPKKTSMWKSVKNATKTSSSVDYNNSTISAPLPDPATARMAPVPVPAAIPRSTSAPLVPSTSTGVPPPKPARTGFGSYVMGSRARSESPSVSREVPLRSESPSALRVSSPDADDSSRRSLDSHGQPKKSSMWKSIKNATHSKSVDYSSSTISAPLDAPQVSQPNTSTDIVGGVGSVEPPKKPSRMSFSGIAKSVTGNRSRSASPAVDRASTGSLNLQVPAQDQHRSAQSMFASEPLPVPSPTKPPKPQFIAQNSAQFQSPSLHAASGLNDLSLGSASSTDLNARINSTRVPDPRQAGYPPLPVDAQQSVPTVNGSLTAGSLAGHRAAGGATQQAQQVQQGQVQRAQQLQQGQAQQVQQLQQVQTQQLQQLQQGVPSSAASADSRSSSPEKKKANSLMAKFMTAKHKKYLTKNPTTTASAAANTSTGTVDSLGDAPAPVNSSISGARAASQPSHSMVSEFDQQGYHTEEEDDEPEPMGISETFEPLSDLSMSSRDIRR